MVETALADVQQLRELYNNTVFKGIFDYFAGRANNSGETTVDALQAALKAKDQPVARGDVIELFKKLEKARCGAFKVGRKGHLSRFVWSMSLISIGQAAAGEGTKVEKITDAERQVAEEEDAPPNALNHRYVLRPGFEVRLDLPEDLSTIEAIRFSEYIRTLPFERATTPSTSA